MIKSDAIYQVLLRYDFDLSRGNNGIYDYLKQHLNQFYTDIVSAISAPNDVMLKETFINMLKAEMPLLQKICEEIPEIIFAFDNGHIPDAYSKSKMLFDETKPYLLHRFSQIDYNGDYYRIRKGDFRITDPAQSIKQKTQMFHIKRNLRNKIGAYRYSIAGYPCLYLASDSDLAWFECGMPKQFSYCKMMVTEEGENALRLVDFSHRPVEIISAFNIWVLNARRQNKNEGEIIKFYEFLLKYIITYPLAAACSLKVKNRDDKFVQEYIFPQLFMQWVLESKDIDGVRYKSSLHSSLVKYRSAVNIALPVKQFRADGLDEKLTQKIAISDIGYIDINKEFEKKQDILAEIKNFKYGLSQYIIASEYCGNYVIDLIDLCECVINVYTALMEGNYENSDLLFTCVNSLCDHIDLLQKNSPTIVQECMNQAPSDKKQYVDASVIESHINEFHRLANQILSKNIALGFSFENLDNFELI